MAQVSFYKITNSQLSSLAKKEGQFIVVTDTKSIYLDTSADTRIRLDDNLYNKLDYTNVAYGTSSTAAATAAKVITISGNSNWKLQAGSLIVVKFSNTNTANNPTLNVNNTGAKSIWYNTALITTSNLGYAATANRPMQFMYDGTQYVFMGWAYDKDTTYTNASLGQGYGTCATAAETVAKVVTLSSYALTTGGIVSVKFTYDVPASATMNINSKGAKPIYNKGAAIAAGVIKGGDTATFIYNGSQYHLISVDSWQEDKTLTHPYYDFLRNGGYADNASHSNANITLFNSAKTAGIRKFYFPQNSTNNAIYYFDSFPNFEDCEIYADKGVQLSWSSLNSVDTFTNAIFKDNITIYSRQQSKAYEIPKNEPDFFNQFSMPSYRMYHPIIKRLSYSETKCYCPHTATGYYVEGDKSSLYIEQDYYIRWNQIGENQMIFVPFDRTKKFCIETVTLPNTKLDFGWFNSQTKKGMFAPYQDGIPVEYKLFNGTEDPAYSSQYCGWANLFEHNIRESFSHDWSRPMKYKLRNDPEREGIDLFINDVFCQYFPWGCSPDLIGFGVFGGNGVQPSNDLGFSCPLEYYEDHTPLNCKLNILIVGDSRTYGYSEQYRIEDVIKNGLLCNGVNQVTIDNQSVSGYTVGQIQTQLQGIDLSNYDMVVLAAGINNYGSTYKQIVETMYNIYLYVTNNHCFYIPIVTMPSAQEGTDAATAARAQVYYMIANAVASAPAYDSAHARTKLTVNVPNAMGTCKYCDEIYGDGTHPTSRGIILFGKIVVNAILSMLDVYPLYGDFEAFN